MFTLTTMEHTIRKLLILNIGSLVEALRSDRPTSSFFVLWSAGR